MEHDRSCTSHRVVADLDGRTQTRVRADEHALAYLRLMLALAIIITGDRTGSDVRLLTDLGVTQIRQVARLDAATHVGVLHLHKIADVSVLVNDTRATQVGKWPNRDTGADNTILDHRLSDFRGFGDRTIHDHARGTNDAGAADRRSPYDVRLRMDNRVRLDRHHRINIRRRRIHNRHASKHVLFKNAGLQNGSRRCKLNAVVDAHDVTVVRRLNALDALFA